MRINELLTFTYQTLTFLLPDAKSKKIARNITCYKYNWL